LNTTHPIVLACLTKLYGEAVAKDVMSRVVAKYGLRFIPSGGQLERMAEAVAIPGRTLA
jgi:hypothetical protein